jgi:ABC-type transport system substrate-binding protein
MPEWIPRRKSARPSPTGYKSWDDKLSGSHAQFAEVDALIDQARATVDRTSRQMLYHCVYRMIRDDAPWLFLYRPRLFWGVKPQARGWTIGLDGLIRLA